jgi:hypothetical protein
MSQEDVAAAKLRTQAYDAFSNYLEAHHKQIVEIEVLPPAIKAKDGLFMVDGLSLGIPKKIFALAFIEARKIFLENIKNEHSHSLALKATRVILFFDPEYLTAANFRKRKLQALGSDDTPAAQLAYRKAIKHEFCLLDSILTSPLHRQSKSPTLWHHRLWLLELFPPKILEHIPEDVRAKFWRAELKSICKSGERHPNNYYAWQYARRLEKWIDGMEATLEFTNTVKDWCCQHPSDTSGWSCLLYLVPKVEPLSKRTTVVRDVMGYCLKLQLDNESLWVFIRSVVAHEALQDRRQDLYSALKEYDIEIERRKGSSPTLQDRIKHTLEWIQKYGNAENASHDSIQDGAS